MLFFLNGFLYSVFPNYNKCQFLASQPPQCVSCPAGARPTVPDWLPVLGVLRTSQHFCWLAFHPFLRSNELLLPKGLSHSGVESVSQSDHSFSSCTNSDRAFHDHQHKICLRCLIGVSQSLDLFTGTHSHEQAQTWKCRTVFKVTTTHNFYSCGKNVWIIQLEIT